MNPNITTPYCLTCQRPDKSTFKYFISQGRREVPGRKLTETFAMYVPRALFWAGLSLSCIHRFSTSVNIDPPTTLHKFPKLAMAASVVENKPNQATRQYTRPLVVIKCFDSEDLDHLIARKFLPLLHTPYV